MIAPIQPLDDAPQETGISYRELTPEEIKSVEPVFAATGNPLPDPGISTFVGAVEDGKVVGFLVLQVKLHAQPMWIEDGKSQVFAPLVAEAERTILKKAGPTWVYLFAPAGRLSQLAQSMGLGLEPWNVLSKLVQPETPAKISVDMLPMVDQQPESGSVQ